MVKAEQNRVLPTWFDPVPITKDKELKRIEFARGDTFSLEANSRCNRDCRASVKAELTWRALINGAETDDIVFSNLNAEKITARVADDAQEGSNITIEAYWAFIDDPNGQRSLARVYAYIVSKPPAPKIVPDYEPVETRWFKVNIWKSEVYGSSNNFIASCSFTLKDFNGKVVDTDKKDTTFGKVMPSGQLQVKGPDIYEITVTCMDSHGSVGSVTEGLDATNVSITRQNSPVINVDKIIKCDIGDCSVKYYINSFGKSLNVTIQDITSGTSPVRCNDQIQTCQLSFVGPGTYTAKIVAMFLVSTDENRFYYSKSSEAFITIVVRQPQAQQPASPAQQPQQVVRQGMQDAREIQPVLTSKASTASGSGADSGCVGFRCPDKQSPGMEGVLGIFALVILALKRIQQNK